MQPYRTGFTFLLSFGAAAVAQSLAACAQGCVGVTSSTCKATDYSCACSSAGYIPELTACIERECNVTQFKEAYQFLEDHCDAVGSPLHASPDASDAETLEKEWKGMDSGGDRLERRRRLLPFELGFTTTFTIPKTSFTPTVTPTLSTTSGAGAASTRASTSGPTASPSSGLSTAAKIGIGLGVPLAVLIIAGLVGLGYWLGRRKRTPAPNPQPEMIAHELDPSTRHYAAEMPTKANMTEMPALEWTGTGGQGVGPAELPESRR